MLESWGSGGSVEASCQMIHSLQLEDGVMKMRVGVAQGVAAGSQDIRVALAQRVGWQPCISNRALEAHPHLTLPE